MGWVKKLLAGATIVSLMGLGGGCHPGGRYARGPFQYVWGFTGVATRDRDHGTASRGTGNLCVPNMDGVNSHRGGSLWTRSNGLGGARFHECQRRGHMARLALQPIRHIFHIFPGRCRCGTPSGFQCRGIGPGMATLQLRPRGCR